MSPILVANPDRAVIKSPFTGRNSRARCSINVAYICAVQRFFGFKFGVTRPGGQTAASKPVTAGFCQSARSVKGVPGAVSPPLPCRAGAPASRPLLRGYETRPNHKSVCRTRPAPCPETDQDRTVRPRRPCNRRSARFSRRPGVWGRRHFIRRFCECTACQQHRQLLQTGHKPFHQIDSSHLFHHNQMRIGQINALRVKAFLTSRIRSAFIATAVALFAPQIIARRTTAESASSATRTVTLGAPARICSSVRTSGEIRMLPHFLGKQRERTVQVGFVSHADVHRQADMSLRVVKVFNDRVVHCAVGHDDPLILNRAQNGMVQVIFSTVPEPAEITLTTSPMTNGLDARIIAALRSSRAPPVPRRQNNRQRRRHQAAATCHPSGTGCWTRIITNAEK